MKKITKGLLLLPCIAALAGCTNCALPIDFYTARVIANEYGCNKTRDTYTYNFVVDATSRTIHEVENISVTTSTITSKVCVDFVNNLAITEERKVETDYKDLKNSENNYKQTDSYKYYFYYDSTKGVMKTTEDGSVVTTIYRTNNTILNYFENSDYLKEKFETEFGYEMEFSDYVKNVLLEAYSSVAEFEFDDLVYVGLNQFTELAETFDDLDGIDYRFDGDIKGNWLDFSFTFLTPDNPNLTTYVSGRYHDGHLLEGSKGSDNIVYHKNAEDVDVKYTTTWRYDVEYNKNTTIELPDFSNID